MIFVTSAKTKLVVIILDVPVIAKCWLKCSASEVCPLKLYFQSGSGTEKEHFLFYKVKSIQMGWISQSDLFSITGPGRVQMKMLNNLNLWRQYVQREQGRGREEE